MSDGVQRTSKEELQSKIRDVDSELQKKINNKVGKNLTIAGMTLEDNISKEELLKSLGFEFANI